MLRDSMSIPQSRLQSVNPVSGCERQPCGATYRTIQYLGDR